MTDKPQHATVTELADFKVAVERRFGRIEKFLALIAVAVISPKLGGPDATTVAAAALHHLTT